MRPIQRLTMALGFLVAATAGVPAAAAQTRFPDKDVCVSIDEARDSLSATERSAALLAITQQFELEGRRVVAERCSELYMVSHVMLGNTILVTMAGPDGRRQARAIGFDDLLALYSQMVRSLVTRRPMTGFEVIDRTNVTASQASQRTIPSDSFGYMRLGVGSIIGDRLYGGTVLGGGYRTELDSFALDVSINFQFKSPSGDYRGPYNSTGAFDTGGAAGSLLKLEALRFINPTANATTYVGAGLSYGGMTFGNNWNGKGLQGEVTVGYELPRATNLRMFVQTDVVLPFYRAQSSTFVPAAGYTTDRRYAPSVALSLGFGRPR